MNRKALGLMALSVFLVAGCAHKSVTSNSADSAAGAPVATVKEVPSFHLNDPEPPQVVDQELESIPIEMNPLVEQWVRYFQGKGRGHMERYLARSTRYQAIMKRILRQNGLPEDLIYIALIESGFSTKATSRAAAVGFWQFIKGTGRRYGLEINGLVDERRDPILSTQSAAEYFKGLYSVFGSWYLAMASYNVGENRVKREVMTHYTRDFWELARKKRFPKETINYVPKFIAAKMIAKNPAKFGFTDIEFETPIEFDTVKVDKPVNLRMMAAKMNVDFEEFQQLNPKFRGEVAPLKATGALELRIPVGQTSVAMAAARESFVDKVELIADASDTTTYKIRSGDSLYTIARKYHTSVAVLRDLNELKAGRKLRIGMRIQVPERSSKKAVAKAPVVKREEKQVAKADDREKADVKPEVVKNGVTYYIVQPGDNLSNIADDYDSTVSELRKMNKLSKSGMIKVGMRLRVPKDDGLPADPSSNKGLRSDDGAESVADQSGDVKSEAGGRGDTVAAGAKPEAAAPASVEGGDVTPQHVVRAGENLTTIAKKYGVSIDAIRKANNLGRRTVLRAGLKLVIPQDRAVKEGPATEGGARRPADSSAGIRGGGKSKNVARTNRERNTVAAAPAKNNRTRVVANAGRGTRNGVGQSRRPVNRVHVVKQGENLHRIAARYGVTPQGIIQQNRIRSGSKVLVGARLLIPVAEAAQ